MKNLHWLGIEDNFPTFCRGNWHFMSNGERASWTTQCLCPSFFSLPNQGIKNSKRSPKKQTQTKGKNWRDKKSNQKSHLNVTMERHMGPLLIWWVKGGTIDHWLGIRGNDKNKGFQTKKARDESEKKKWWGSTGGLLWFVCFFPHFILQTRTMERTILERFSLKHHLVSRHQNES